MASSEKLGEKVSIGEPEYGDAKSPDPTNQQGQPALQAALPAHQTIQPPKMRLMVDGRIKGREYSIKIAGGEEAPADRMTIVPIEAGNYIRLTKGDSVVREIPISSIQSASQFSEVEQGLLGVRNNRKINPSYTDGSSHSLTIDVDDGKANEIVRELNTLRDIEHDYFNVFEIEYLDGSAWTRSRVYLRTPFLAQGERVVWKQEETGGVFSKHYKWIKVVTNFRAMYYDFETHLVNYITLPAVEDVLVTDKRTESTSQRGSGGTSHSTRVTVGDIVLMDAGAPFIRLNEVDDPDGVATMICLAVKASHSAMLKAKTDAPAAAEPKKPVCSACGYLNTANAKFCSQCGTKI